MLDAMETTWRLYSCDDHLDLWSLARHVHPDRTFPNSRAGIAHAFQGLDADFVEGVTATTCKRLYRFA